MRFFVISLLALIVAALVVFAVQNHEVVTIGFLTGEVFLPLSLVIILTYFLGMVTGGSVMTIIKNLWHRTRRKPLA